jgi:TatA/E family protein of Tat protein translocase
VLNLDPAKLLIIAVVAVILLGPDKLPQVARQVGAAWRSFNEFRHRMESEVRSSIPDLPSSADIARLARSPSALLNHLSNMAPDETEGAAGRGTSERGAGGRDILGPTGQTAWPPRTSVSTSSEVPGNESAVTGVPHPRHPSPHVDHPASHLDQSLPCPPSTPPDVRRDRAIPASTDRSERHP